jgi:hypothetical protein
MTTDRQDNIIQNKDMINQSSSHTHTHTHIHTRGHHSKIYIRINVHCSKSLVPIPLTPDYEFNPPHIHTQSSDPTIFEWIGHT